MSPSDRQPDQLDRLVQLAVDSRSADPQIGPEIDMRPANAAISALASAWSTFRLYPNPTEQPGFRQAMTNLHEAVAVPTTFDVGAGSLTFSDTVVGGGRSIIEQLATRMYIHDIDRFTVEPLTSGEELCKVFEVLAQDRDQGRSLSRAAATLEALDTVHLSLRGVLDDEETRHTGGDVDEGAARPARENELARMVDEGATADEVFDRLLKITRGDDAEIRRQFISAFREVHTEAVESGDIDVDLADMLLPYSVDDLGPSPTATFIDVYFRLPEQTRLEILEAFLVNTMSGESRMFLDQFSGDELAEMAPNVSPNSFDALVEYAKASAEADLDMSELLSMLHSSGDVSRARRGTATHLVRLLDRARAEPREEAISEIHDELAPDRQEDHGLAVVRGLFATVDDDRRFTRLAMVWVGQIRRRLQVGGLAEAMQAIAAVRDDPPYPLERAATVDNALSALVTSQLIHTAATHDDPTERDAVVRFILLLGRGALRKVMERLAVEQDAGTRRALVELLATITADDPQPLLAALGDERWYVVRNVVAVLARTGAPEVIQPISRVADHPDPRVRTEVLRALVRLSKRESTLFVLEALSDSSDRVRQTSVMLLPSLETTAIENRLIEIVTTAAAPDDAIDGVAEYLAQHSARGRESLRVLAGRRFVLRKQHRIARSAARAALRVAA